MLTMLEQFNFIYSTREIYSGVKLLTGLVPARFVIKIRHSLQNEASIKSTSEAVKLEDEDNIFYRENNYKCVNAALE